MRGHLLFLICCISSGAWGDCTGGDDIKLYFDMGTHYVPRDAPIGSVIGTANVIHAYEHTTAINCKHGDYREARLSPWPKVAGISLPSITGGIGRATVVKTNVPGVGLVVIARDLSPAQWSIPGNDSFPFAPYRVFQVFNPAGKFPAIKSDFTLVKINNDIPMGSSAIKNSTPAVMFWSIGRHFQSVFLTGTVVRSECSLADGINTYVEVPMGKVVRFDFKGKDSHLDSKDVVIPLINCTAGTYPTDQTWNFYQNSNAHLRLEGVQGSVILDARRGILGLTPDSTAKGVAVQILRKDGVTPLILGQEVSIARLSGTRMNIELTARYIQTSDSVAGPEPGSANARAAFTLTYK